MPLLHLANSSSLENLAQMPLLLKTLPVLTLLKAVLCAAHAAMANNDLCFLSKHGMQHVLGTQCALSTRLGIADDMAEAKRTVLGAYISGALCIGVLNTL